MKTVVTPTISSDSELKMACSDVEVAEAVAAAADPPRGMRHALLEFFMLTTQ